MKKRWRKIKGYANLYMVSDAGEIMSVKTGKIKKQFINNSGYRIMRLHKSNVVKNVLPHRITATEFIANPDKLPYVNHKNGIKTDNRVENLEWCTPTQNSLHSYRMRRERGETWRMYPGEENFAAKITAADAMFIFESGLEPIILAHIFGITTSVVHHIRTGRSWSSVTGLNYQTWKSYQSTTKSTQNLMRSSSTATNRPRT